MPYFPSTGCMHVLSVRIACGRKISSMARDVPISRGKDDQKMPLPFPKPAVRGVFEDTARG